MNVATLVLLHSPLTGAAVWGRLPERLADAGLSVVPEVTNDDVPPFAVRYVAEAARQIGAGEPDDPVVLVGHSGAGPLLPRVGFARRAVHRPVAGYLFCDAGLPRAGGPASRLDLMSGEDAGFAGQLRTALEQGGRFPKWSADELADQVGDPADRAPLAASLRPRGAGRCWSASRGTSRRWTTRTGPRRRSWSCSWSCEAPAIGSGRWRPAPPLQGAGRHRLGDSGSGRDPEPIQRSSSARSVSACS